MRAMKSYNGELMDKGTKNENLIIDWIKNNPASKSIIDFRDFRLAQRMDVDCGIETIDGTLVLAEIKSDKLIDENGNLCFECYRVNHFVKDRWFYLGWGWRSPAQKLIIRNPNTGITFFFNFVELREKIGKYIARVGRKLRQNITETDEQKTTFNLLIPMSEFKGLYKKCIIRGD